MTYPVDEAFKAADFVLDRWNLLDVLCLADGPCLSLVGAMLLVAGSPPTASSPVGQAIGCVVATAAAPPSSPARTPALSAHSAVLDLD